MRMLAYLRALLAMPATLSRLSAASERQALMLGRLLAARVRECREVASLADVEFQVFSQFGDDGIIQWLVHRLAIEPRTFVEFGVEDYAESNTRFLMMNDDWSGLVMDASPRNVRRIVGAPWFWRHALDARAAFVDRDNVNALIAASGLRGDIGLLHVDIDGNDYWIWDAIDVVSPAIAILEYNSVLGPDRAITVPYDPAFDRRRAHPSCLYYGASLLALHRLATARGYAFVGCNSAGNNADFVRRDRLRDGVREVSPEAGYVASRFRESRDARGRLSLLAGDSRLAAIRGLPVINVDTGRPESL